LFASFILQVTYLHSNKQSEKKSTDKSTWEWSTLVFLNNFLFYFFISIYNYWCKLFIFTSLSKIILLCI